MIKEARPLRVIDVRNRVSLCTPQWSEYYERRSLSDIDPDNLASNPTSTSSAEDQIFSPDQAVNAAVSIELLEIIRVPMSTLVPGVALGAPGSSGQAGLLGVHCCGRQ
jgi:hypothetical protein